MKTLYLPLLLATGLMSSPDPDEVQLNAESVDAQRMELLARWGTDALPQPAAIEELAATLLALPIKEQSARDLESLADLANRAANFIGFISDEYSAYYRENYAYDFVQEKVAPFHDAYVAEANKFKGFRNQAYFNLGIKHRNGGNEVLAFFYFRDAFRLSTFTEPGGDHRGLRYKAEIEMKKLLGCEELETFVYWK